MTRLLFGLMLLMGMLACQSNSKPATDSESTNTDSFKVEDGTSCYLFNEGPDSTFLTLTIKGNKVTGYMAWAPWEKDGASGELSGTLDGNKIIADWDYTIEGSEQAEEKIFIVEADAVGEMTGELTEGPGGKLVLKDPANAKIGTYLNKVDCKE